MPTPTVAEMMEAYAADAVDIARANFQVELDYSYASISRLEEILERQHASIPKGWRKLFGKQPDNGTIQTFAKIWGGYLGEVVRRKWGGEWFIAEDGPFSGAVCLRSRGMTLSPPARVYKRIINGDEDSVSTYIHALDHISNNPARP